MNVICQSAVWHFLLDKFFCHKAEAISKATHGTEAFNSSTMKADLKFSPTLASIGKANSHSVAQYPHAVTRL